MRSIPTTDGSSPPISAAPAGAAGGPKFDNLQRSFSHGSRCSSVSSAAGLACFGMAGYGPPLGLGNIFRQHTFRAPCATRRQPTASSARLIFGFAVDRSARHLLAADRSAAAFRRLIDAIRHAGPPCGGWPYLTGHAPGIGDRTSTCSRNSLRTDERSRGAAGRR